MCPNVQTDEVTFIKEKTGRNQHSNGSLKVSIPLHKRPPFKGFAKFYLINFNEFTVKCYSSTLTMKVCKDEGNICLLIYIRAYRNVCTYLSMQEVQILLDLDENAYDKKRRRFRFPISKHNILTSALYQGGVTVEGLPSLTLSALSLGQRGRDPASSSSSSSSSSSPEAKSDPILSLPRKLQKILAPFQKDGVRGVIKNDGRIMLCDEMGLGKTIQAIATCIYYRKEWPVLIITPSSVRLHWQEQLLLWLDVSPNDVVVINKATYKTLGANVKFLIISYGLISKSLKMLSTKTFQIGTILTIIIHTYIHTYIHACIHTYIHT